jgi:hypothetical protein
MWVFLATESTLEAPDLLTWLPVVKKNSIDGPRGIRTQALPRVPSRRGIPNRPHLTPAPHRVFPQSSVTWTLGDPSLSTMTTDDYNLPPPSSHPSQAHPWTSLFPFSFLYAFSFFLVFVVSLLDSFVASKQGHLLALLPLPKSQETKQPPTPFPSPLPVCCP